jgi:hypothetical protein
MRWAAPATMIGTTPVDPVGQYSQAVTVYV